MVKVTGTREAVHCPVDVVRVEPTVAVPVIRGKAGSSITAVVERENTLAVPATFVAMALTVTNFPLRDALVLTEGELLAAEIDVHPVGCVIDAARTWDAQLKNW